MRAMNAKPLNPHRPALATLQPASRPATPPSRASLEGLEVQESCFGQWLAAGGERRTRPREDSTGPKHLP